MFSITVHHAQYHRTPCSVSPYIMLRVTVHHVQYHRTPCLISLCTMFGATVYLPTLVHYAVYTKSHIGYRYRCRTKCTAHQFLTSSAITLPGSKRAVRSQPYGKLECQYKSVRNKRGPQTSLDISAFTNKTTDTHGSKNCSCRNWIETQNPDSLTPTIIKVSLNLATILEWKRQNTYKCVFKDAAN
jgi:hypothetical protein